MEYKYTDQLSLQYPRCCIGCGDDNDWGLAEYGTVEKPKWKSGGTRKTATFNFDCYLCEDCIKRGKQMVLKSQKRSKIMAVIGPLAFVFGFLMISSTLPWFEFNIFTGFFSIFCILIGGGMLIEGVRRIFFYRNLPPYKAYYNFRVGNSLFGSKIILVVRDGAYAQKIRQMNDKKIGKKTKFKVKVKKGNTAVPPDLFLTQF